MAVSFLLRAAAPLVGLLTLAGFVPTTNATQHDPCVHEAGGQIGQDSGDLWILGNRMFPPTSCLGEMDAADPDDWYWIPLPLIESSSTLTATLCSDFVTIAPWETDLALYFLPASAGLPSPGLPPAVQGLSGDLPAGIPMGSSHNAGCDSVTATMTAGANNGRWYVNVNNNGFGQGGYHMTLALS